MTEKNNKSLYEIFGDTSVQPLLVGISGFQLLVVAAAIFTNSMLIYVTIRSRNLHGTCNWFIAVEAFFNILTMSSFAFPLYLEIVGKNFIKLGDCRPIQAYSVFASTMRKFALFLISFDRLLVVSFPLIFGWKPMLFFFILLAISIVYSGVLITLVWLAIDPADIYNRKVLCVTSDLSNNIGPVGTFVTSNSMAFASLATVSYLLIWAILKWKRDRTEEEKTCRQYTRKLYKMLLSTTVLTLIGWFLNPLIRLTIPNLNLTTIQNLWFTNAASCISNLGMFATPIVIYIFSSDYKEAFRKLLFDIGICKQHQMSIEMLRNAKRRITGTNALKSSSIVPNGEVNNTN